MTRDDTVAREPHAAHDESEPFRFTFGGARGSACAPRPERASSADARASAPRPISQVVESHPEHPLPDVRILQPPAALRELVSAQYADLGALPNHVFSHTPWAILLIKAVDEWKAANGGGACLQPA